LKKNKLKKLLIISVLFLLLCDLYSQPVPSIEENIPFLVTFGKDGDVTWGDDDFSQVFFVVIPDKFLKPFYIRVFDPDCGGMHDELKGEANTKTTFSIIGGKCAYTHSDSKNIDPLGNYKCGNLLAMKTFGNDPKFDNKWYTFGPFNPSEGEYVEDFQGYVFKIVVDGVSGDDGNLYRLFISTSNKENIPIEGCNAFTYEYTFRLYDEPGNISHIYPYIDDKVISVKISNFDWDNDGVMRIISVAKNGIQIEISGEGEWKHQILPVVAEERGTSFDLQFVKTKYIKNNNVVVYITNQYGELLPFYVSPIGGIPQYKGKIRAVKIKKQ